MESIYNSISNYLPSKNLFTSLYTIFGLYSIRSLLISAEGSSPEIPDFSISEMVLCGNRVYKKEDSYQAFLQTFSSLLWFSYRRDFPPITPTTYTSDMGWGCMLRCAQMMLANALSRHTLGTGNFTIKSEITVVKTGVIRNLLICKSIKY